MQSHRVTGAGGVQLHVVEAGPKSGRPVVLIHGFSYSQLAFRKQLESDLAGEFRLVAPDLRGHGFSDKPVGGYDDPAVWAEDLHAVIAGLGLERPVLMGWSYGGMVIARYLAAHGESGVAGVGLVGALTPSALGAGPVWKAVAPHLGGTDLTAVGPALEQFIRGCVHGEVEPADLCLFLGMTLLTPPHVRQALTRVGPPEPGLPALSVPVLIAHGVHDQIVPLRVGEKHAALLPAALTSWYDGVGHNPFWEAPARFNRELAEFVRSCH